MVIDGQNLDNRWRNYEEDDKDHVVDSDNTWHGFWDWSAKSILWILGRSLG